MQEGQEAAPKGCEGREGEERVKLVADPASQQEGRSGDRLAMAARPGTLDFLAVGQRGKSAEEGAGGVREHVEQGSFAAGDVELEDLDGEGEGEAQDGGTGYGETACAAAHQHQKRRRAERHIKQNVGCHIAYEATSPDGGPGVEQEEVERIAGVTVKPEMPGVEGAVEDEGEDQQEKSKQFRILAA